MKMLIDMQKSLGKSGDFVEYSRPGSFLSLVCSFHMNWELYREFVGRFWIS